MPNQRFQSYTGFARYGSVGIELILSIAVGYYGGRWLDGKLGTAGWLTGVGFVFGVIAGFRQIFVAARGMMREAEAEEERDRRAGIVLPTFPKGHDRDHDVLPFDEEKPTRALTPSGDGREPGRSER